MQAWLHGITCMPCIFEESSKKMMVGRKSQLYFSCCDALAAASFAGVQHPLSRCRTYIKAYNKSFGDICCTEGRTHLSSLWRWSRRKMFHNPLLLDKCLLLELLACLLILCKTHHSRDDQQDMIADDPQQVRVSGACAWSVKLQMWR